jgi:hypothetical protein
MRHSQKYLEESGSDRFKVPQFLYGSIGSTRNYFARSDGNPDFAWGNPVFRATLYGRGPKAPRRERPHPESPKTRKT